MNPTTYSDFPARVGQAIAERRQLACITQAELAERLGVSQETVSRMENGHFDPPMARLPEMADLFGCQVAEFFVRASDTVDSNAFAISYFIDELPREDQEHVLDLVASTAKHLIAIRAKQRRRED